jgi:hypothetical protein
MGQCDRRRWVGGLTRYGNTVSHNDILNITTIVAPMEEVEDREDGNVGVLKKMQLTWPGYP